MGHGIKESAPEVIRSAQYFGLHRFALQPQPFQSEAQLMGDGSPWLLRFYRQDELACAFCQQFLTELSRPPRQVWSEDEADGLLSYLINPPTH